MNKKEHKNLTEDDLIKSRKKLYNTKIINATFIGFLIGIVVWGVAKNNWGFFTLIPLFFIVFYYRKYN